MSRLDTPELKPCFTDKTACSQGFCEFPSLSCVAEGAQKRGKRLLPGHQLFSLGHVGCFHRESYGKLR